MTHSSLPVYADIEVAAATLAPVAVRTRLLNSPALDALCVILLIGGLAFTLWARVALGANWSGTVTIQQGHELISTGPYALVRHPIYTGILMMMLGTALTLANVGALVAFALAIVLLWTKLRLEERLMRETFGEEYCAYQRRVKALIPGVL